MFTSFQLVLVVATFAVFLAAPAKAQGFDCKKAASVVEKAICDDAQIGDLDKSLSHLFSDSLKYSAPSQRSALLLEQRRWLAHRDKFCKPPSWVKPELFSQSMWSCLFSVYTERLDELRAKPPFIPDSSGMVSYCSGGVSDDNIVRGCSVADNQRLIDESRVVSGDKGFCTRLMNSHWRYLPLAETHTVTKDEANEFLELRGADTDIDPHAGFFDINNDGKPEHLARITAYSGAGQGCDVEEYVEMNAERTHLVPSTLTKLLEYKKCETYERAFLFDGKTYIENRRILSLKEVPSILPNVLSEVWIIEGNKKRSVCNFSNFSLRNDD